MNRTMLVAGRPALHAPSVGDLARKRKAFSIICVVSSLVLLGGVALLAPARAGTEVSASHDRRTPDLDPAAFDLGNTDTGAMMAMIHRAIGLND